MPRAEDITYLPVFIIYQYFFAALKLYAAFTLNNTAWGTRDANAFKSKEEIDAENSPDADPGVLVNEHDEQNSLLAHKAVQQMRSLHQEAMPHDAQSNPHATVSVAQPPSMPVAKGPRDDPMVPSPRKRGSRRR